VASVDEREAGPDASPEDPRRTLMHFWIGFAVGATSTVVAVVVGYVALENLAFRRFWGP
jgi:hypothetical protein